MAKEYDYKKDLEIDKYDLDNEFLNHHLLFVKWAELEVNAEIEKNKAESRLDLVKAELSNSVRTNPSLLAGEKMTEGAIKDYITTHESRKQAEEEYLDALKNFKVLSVARKGFEQRKSDLEWLGKLYFDGYWADPKSPRSNVSEKAIGNAVKGKQEESLKESLERRRRRK